MVSRRKLQRDLTEPMVDPRARIEFGAGARMAAALRRSSFGSPTFADVRWHAMAASKEISIAGAVAVQKLGSSNATLCTQRRYG